MTKPSTRTFRSLISSNLRVAFALGAFALALPLATACGDDDDDLPGTAGVSVQTRRCSRIQGSAGLLGCENR